MTACKCASQVFFLVPRRSATASEGEYISDNKKYVEIFSFASYAMRWMSRLVYENKYIFNCILVSIILTFYHQHHAQANAYFAKKLKKPDIKERSPSTRRITIKNTKNMNIMRYSGWDFAIRK